MLIGCRQQKSDPTNTGLVFVDDLNRQVHLQGIPRRIVSLAPNITETLFAIGADSLVVGVTNFCDFPPQVSGKTKVGSLINPSIEAIVSLEPDIVIMTVEGNTEQTFQKLSHLGIPIFVTNPRSLPGVIKSIHDLGQISGMTERAGRIEDSIQHVLTRLESFSDRQPKVLMFVSLDPLMVVGRNTFIDEMMTRTGGINAAKHVGENYPAINREELLLRNPDIILIPTDIQRQMEDILTQYPEWRSIEAAKKNRIFFVDANLLQRPGPRVLAGLEKLQQIFAAAMR